MGAWLWIAVFAFSVVVSWVLVRGIRLIAPRFNLVDVPNSRSLHSQPTPRGGGLAIALVGMAGIAIGGFMVPVEWRQIAAYLLGGSLLAFVGLVDDLRVLSQWPKLAIQIVAAICLMVGLAQHLLSFDPWPQTWIVLVAGVFATIALTNIYNFMDGSDGMAATQGVLGGIGWAVITVSRGRLDLGLLSVLVAAGCLGFLAHNLPPASIFLGDVGSAFLGFTFAFLPLAMANHAAQLFAGLLMIWPFVFDASVTVGRRLAQRQNIFKAHREHLYQRLVLAGWPPRAVLLLYALFSLGSVLLAEVWWDASVTVRGLVLVLLVLSSGALWRVVARAEAFAISRSVRAR